MSTDVTESPCLGLHRPQAGRPSPRERCTTLLIVLGQFQPGDDVHGLQLLEEQLTGVRDAEGGHVARRLAEVAPETQVSTHQWGGMEGGHTVAMLRPHRCQA